MPPLRSLVPSAVAIVLTVTLLNGCTQRHDEPIDTQPLTTESVGEKTPVNPFPAITDVHDIRATITIDLPPERPIPWFSVPPEHWEVLLTAMLPAETHTNPPGWEVVGWLEIATDDKNLKVMFSTDAMVLFRIGDEYFRGGQGEQLESVIRAAYKDAAK